MKLTIRQLRQAGFKVRVIHERNKEVIPGRKLKMEGGMRLSCKGGNTTIEVSSPNGFHHAFGNAYCSTKDNFNRKIGNSIALGRALSILSEVNEVKDILEKV